MIGTDSNHLRIVTESLTGQREMDEKTLAALAVLDEKLERLKKLGGAFSDIAFSEDVEKLKSHKHAVSVGR
ncbi:MAG: hypothetical protein JSW47_08075 [Phycisphaerales bacterium]|nr:MAG: hypothetical protein JSW47_08075 [Phycisphaerales bacterium]UCF14370.1 MAG: hypothetical protein JSW59_13225 [Phycisphaerales bacterium]